MGKGGSIGNIGFGAMGLTAFYGAPKTTDEVTSILQGIYDLGCRHYDTAELYKTGNPMADSDEDVYNEQQMEPFLASVPRELSQLLRSSCLLNGVRSVITRL